VLRIGGAALILLAVASVARAEGRDPMKLPDTQLEPVAWSEIDGWAEDDHNAAFATFLNSCKAILRGTKEMREARPVYGALYEACRMAAAANPHKPGEARAFFEQNFRPVRIAPLGEPDGFLTGYYEPIVDTREQAWFRLSALSQAVEPAARRSHGRDQHFQRQPRKAQSPQTSAGAVQ
jgi:membrane-bound lytic murein transglycosylase A